jgi:hypothetical protein
MRFDLNESDSGEALAGNFLSKKVGPFYDEDGAARVTGLSREELTEHARSNALLEVRTSGGIRRYPTFQFGPHGDPLPFAGQLAAILEPICDDAWDLALWLCTLTRRFEGRSAADLLRDGESDRVFAAARRDANILNY